MAIKQFDIEQGVKAFEFKTDLENVPYGFRFTYNIRLETWTMDVKDDAGTHLVSVPVHVNQDLLKLHRHDKRMPQGVVFAINLVNEDVDPTEDNLGSDVLVLYEEAG